MVQRGTKLEIAEKISGPEFCSPQRAGPEIGAKSADSQRALYLEEKMQFEQAKKKRAAQALFKHRYDYRA